jgi:hypothetical protein
MGLINIYCDESCHLENDGIGVMTLGAIWCEASERRRILREIQEIKARYYPGKRFEVKWQKLAITNFAMYQDLVNYFFDNDCLHFRGLVVPDKSLLNHAAVPGQDHRMFYYKMYFQLLSKILGKKDATYNIFLDTPDSNSGARIKTLHEILCNTNYDFEHEIVRSVHTLRSHDAGLIQLADIFAGALSYANRNIGGLPNGKSALIALIRRRSRFTLRNSTLLGEDKFNIFVWRGRGL